MEVVKTTYFPMKSLKWIVLNSVFGRTEVAEKSGAGLDITALVYCKLCSIFEALSPGYISKIDKLLVICKNLTL